MTDTAPEPDKKNRLAAESDQVGQSGSRTLEKRKLEVLVACTEDIERAVSKLEQSMTRNAESSQKLATRVAWLNVVLTAATVVGAAAAAMSLFKQAGG